MTEHVRSEQADGVLTLTLNRPEKKNALTRDMYRRLGDALDGAKPGGEVRCVLLQAEGDMFCAGNDLTDFTAMNAGQGPAEWEGNPFLTALARAEIPLVAAVHGRAVGVGVTMLLHCDLVFVAEDALLTAPFVSLGLVPEAASSLLVPARIGHARAFSLFVLGEAVDAHKAVAWGLANAVVPKAALRERARAAALAVAAQPPAAVAVTKALLRDSAVLAQRMEREGRHFMTQLRSAEVTEALRAFAEKRAPDFQKLRRSPR